MSHKRQATLAKPHNTKTGIPDPKGNCSSFNFKQLRLSCFISIITFIQFQATQIVLFYLYYYVLLLRPISLCISKQTLRSLEHGTEACVYGERNLIASMQVFKLYIGCRIEFNTKSRLFQFSPQHNPPHSTCLIP